MDHSDELRRLLDGPRTDEVAPGVGLVTLTARSADPAAVLGRTREVLTAVVRDAGPPWPAPEVWARVLPDWFLQGCALAPADRSRWSRQEAWSLPDWLVWFEPDERQWWWWDGAVTGPRLCVVQVEVQGWPVPLGALRWLLRVAGADEVDDDA